MDNGVSLTEAEALYLGSLDMNCLVNNDSFVPSLPLLRASLVEAVTCPPMGLVVDMGVLFGIIPGEKLGTNKNIKNTVLLNYEDHFLRRLQADSLYIPIKDALFRLPEAKQAEALIYLLNSILERLAYIPSFSLPLSVARHMMQKPMHDLLRMKQTVMDDFPYVYEKLQQDYGYIAKAARHSAHLLHENNEFVIENISVLRSMSQRMALEQILDAAENINSAISNRILANSSEIGIVATKIQTDDEYPVGGFSSITNTGKMENLVSSELIYMNDGDDIDLFDIRYSEGELLYYSRDENQFFRQIRQYGLILHNSLLAGKVKSPRLPYQDLVLVKAILLCILRRLCLWLSSHDLSIKLYYQGDIEDKMIQQEIAQANLLFQEWIKSGVLHIHHMDNIEAIQCDNIVLFSYGESMAQCDDALLHWHIEDHMPVLYHGEKKVWQENEIDNIFQNWIKGAECLLSCLY